MKVHSPLLEILGDAGGMPSETDANGVRNKKEYTSLGTLF